MARLATSPSAIIMRRTSLRNSAFSLIHFGDDVARAFQRLVRGGDASFPRSRRWRRNGPAAAPVGFWSQRYCASGSRPFSRAMEALVRRLGL